MKAIFKSIFFCLTLMLGLSACTGKNEEMPPTGGLDHAEQLAVGTYVGTWTCTNQTTRAETTATGSVTFASTEEMGNNVVSVTIISDDKKALNLGAKAETSACNITRLSSGILSFWNVYNMNPFGFTFTGKITPEGDVTFNYTAAVVKNHKETLFDYSFSGKKQ